MTSISITGNILDQSTKDDVVAYGLNGSHVSFSITYDNSLLNSSNPDVWHITSDKSTGVADYSLGASVNKGCLLILKKQRGGEYELAANPITNFTYGADNFYTPSGEDVYAGTYYKIVFAYSSRVRTQKGFIGIGEKYDTYYHTEIYEFYLCENSANMSIHNLSIADEHFDNEEYDINLLKKGETLIDGSVTTQGFKIDKLNISGNSITVKYNDTQVSPVADGTTFTEPGKYEITTITKLGKQKTQVIYIFHTDDNGYATYFGESLIHASRVFRFGDYPTYAKGAYIAINEVDENTPILYGTVVNLDTEQVVFNTTQTRAAQKFDLAPGNYQIEFYSGNPDISGSLFKYIFRFEIIDEKSAPYVNYYNLMSTERLEDLQSKHYEVAYQTTGGGYIFVCFSLESYDDAFEYAYEIEKRFIEKQENGLYYKSIDNPSLKVKYFDYVELTAALNFYAKKNVEINYFNPLDTFTYQTYNNDLLGSLEALSLTDSIKVFPSQDEKDRLIKRRPYINNFQFINVADYDVISVTAFCEKDNKTYNIEFNKPIEEQLHVSSKYTITETNIYGDSVSYDVYFINEIQTISHWTASQNGVESVIDVSVRDIINGKMEITAEYLVLNDITNALDTDAIVTIKAPDIYAFEIKCQISEMKGFTIYETGVYELTFIDMLGNSYTLIATITGAQWQDVLAQDTTSYTSLYNAVYLNSTVENAEEWAYDDTAFSKTMLDISAIPHMLYTAETIQPLVEQYNIALSASQNNPTQKEIDAFNQQLVLLMSQLQLRENKQYLFDLLTHFTTLDFSSLSNSEATKYRETYEEACAVLYNLDATDVEISDATNAILSLQEKLTNPELAWYWFVIISVCTVGLIGGSVLFYIIRRKKK